jgi:glutathione S-transferase
MQAKVPQNMAECFDWIESDLLRGPWVMGERLSIATPTCSPWPAGWPATESTIARYPRVAGASGPRMAALPAVQRGAVAAPVGPPGGIACA